MVARFPKLVTVEFRYLIRADHEISRGCLYGSGFGFSKAERRLLGTVAGTRAFIYAGDTDFERHSEPLH